MKPFEWLVRRVHEYRDRIVVIHFHFTKPYYHITVGPRVPEHSAGNRINALVQYRFLVSRFALITLSQTGNKRHVFAENI